MPLSETTSSRSARSWPNARRAPRRGPPSPTRCPASPRSRAAVACGAFGCVTSSSSPPPRRISPAMTSFRLHRNISSAASAAASRIRRRRWRDHGHDQSGDGRRDHPGSTLWSSGDRPPSSRQSAPSSRGGGAPCKTGDHFVSPSARCVVRIESAASAATGRRARSHREQPSP